MTETGREIVEYTSIHMLLDIILSRNIQMQYNIDTIAEDLEPIISQNKRRGLIDYTSMMPMYMTRCGREYPLLNLVERLNEGKMTIEDFSNLTLLPMSYARRVAARLFYAPNNYYQTINSGKEIILAFLPFLQMNFVRS